MKTIACLQDLEPYGLVPLTGEACGLGYRILFDVTARGRRILARAFGIPDFRLAEAWNRGKADDPHVGSILLATQLLAPVGIFALLDEGCTDVWLHADGTLLGVEPTDPPDAVQRVRRLRQESLIRCFAPRGTAGDRNVHVMSGRVE